MDEKEDPEWRDRVDSVILYDRIEELRTRIRDLEHIVTKGKDNLRSEYTRHDQELIRINAVLFQDPTGQKGLLHDVDFLMGRRKYDNQSRELKWKFATEIVIKILALVGVLLLGWDKIEGLYKKIASQKPSPLEEKIERAKRPRGKTLYRVRVVPEKAVSENTEESQPKPE